MDNCFAFALTAFTPEAHAIVQCDEQLALSVRLLIATSYGAFLGHQQSGVRQGVPVYACIALGAALYVISLLGMGLPKASIIEGAFNSAAMLALGVGCLVLISYPHRAMHWLTLCSGLFCPAAVGIMTGLGNAAGAGVFTIVMVCIFRVFHQGK
jgi:uncharacterized membrane protein YhiD involved in acid resistance